MRSDRTVVAYEIVRAVALIASPVAIPVALYVALTWLVGMVT